MPEPLILKLARDLEWLGCELEYQGLKHANEGFPEAGPTWEDFIRMRQGSRHRKLERELKARLINPATLVGVSYPQDASTHWNLIQARKFAPQSAVHELPARVRAFPQLVTYYLGVLGQSAGKRESLAR
jgi:hypothetical protein